MRAGKLRNRLELQSYIVTRDDIGGEVRTWSTFVTVWGAVEPVSGRESEVATQDVAQVSHNVTIRYDDSVGPEHRVLFNSRVFQIIAVLNVGERNAEMRLSCKELP